VITTEATIQDTSVIDELHDALTAKALPPSEYLVDQGYSDSASITTARDKHNIEMVVPIRSDRSWQQRAGNGYGFQDFQIDWEAQQVTCPQGKTSASWVPG